MYIMSVPINHTTQLFIIFVYKMQISTCGWGEASKRILYLAVSFSHNNNRIVYSTVNNADDDDDFCLSSKPNSFSIASTTFLLEKYFA